MEFICVQCGYTLTNANRLVAHGDGGYYVCPHCDTQAWYGDLPLYPPGTSNPPGVEYASQSDIETAILAAITPEMVVYDAENCHLLFSKYPDGRMEITGTVEGENGQVIYPSGCAWIDPSLVGVGFCYTALDDQSNNTMHVGKIQVSATDFIWNASSFLLAVLGGSAVDDDAQYRITLTGRWK